MGLNLRDIRDRIKGIRNIGQVTRAMDMVASSRLRRAQSRAQAARPYADRLAEIMRRLSPSLTHLDHPLLQQRHPVEKVGLIVVSSDRGLCGAYNSNLFREVGDLLERLKDPLYELVVVGQQALSHYQRRDISIDEFFAGTGKEVSTSKVNSISRQVISSFTTGKYDQVWIVFTRFINTMKGEPVSEQILPLDPQAPAAPENSQTRTSQVIRETIQRQVEYLFEPSQDEMANYLLPLYVEVRINGALLDANASEHAARMVAMRNATENAEEMVSNLVKTYNRTRQGSITREILEVVSGAEALKSRH